MWHQKWARHTAPFLEPKGAISVAVPKQGLMELGGQNCPPKTQIETRNWCQFLSPSFDTICLPRDAISKYINQSSVPGWNSSHNLWPVLCPVDLSVRPWGSKDCIHGAPRPCFAAAGHDSLQAPWLAQIYWWPGPFAVSTTPLTSCCTWVAITTWCEVHLVVLELLAPARWSEYSFCGGEATDDFRLPLFPIVWPPSSIRYRLHRSSVLWRQLYSSVLDIRETTGQSQWWQVAPGKFVWRWWYTEVGLEEELHSIWPSYHLGIVHAVQFFLLMCMRTNNGFWHPPGADGSQQVLTNYRYRCVMRKAMMTLASTQCYPGYITYLAGSEQKAPSLGGHATCSLCPPFRGAAPMLLNFLMPSSSSSLMSFSWQWWPGKAHVRGVWAGVVFAPIW